MHFKTNLNASRETVPEYLHPQMAAACRIPIQGVCFHQCLKKGIYEQETWFLMGTQVRS